MAMLIASLLTLALRTLAFALGVRMVVTFALALALGTFALALALGVICSCIHTLLAGPNGKPCAN